MKCFLLPYSGYRLNKLLPCAQRGCDTEASGAGWMPIGRLYRPPWHHVLRLEGFIATRLEGRSFESWSELQPFADSATAALAAVHEAGVLHGDLRPQNFCHAGHSIHTKRRSTNSMDIVQLLLGLDVLNCFGSVTEESCCVPGYTRLITALACICMQLLQFNMCLLTSLAPTVLPDL